MGIEDNQPGHKKVKISLPLNHKIYDFVYYNLNISPPPKVRIIEIFYLDTCTVSMNFLEHLPFQNVCVAIDNFVYI